MKRPFLVLWVVLSGLLFAKEVTFAETLYFITQTSDIGWNTVENCYVPGPNNTFTLAGRIPASGDDVIMIAPACNAASTSPQLLSLTVQQGTAITGGNFEVGTMNFS